MVSIKEINATTYFTRWVEATPTKQAMDKVVIEFLEDKIITRSKILAKMTTDNAKAFSSWDLQTFCFDHGIVFSHL
jgi:hypothetical protein